ncbi:Zinc finger BED domain-containing protein DAYSLEEPER [Fusarium oxysporum f. sp. raphani]|uniref:Zinc finger BED domain-containing protein DAYSLEEPER n=1 Tax=Fusarium oxysporum f. sp. raphani TaxID=96318 RepID=A0A8J5PDV2_FUSOX|nr:Zinc finger BED domain-containing protein DAYSLEEPER [Fusarium oxysporum f. sp. raphani]
MEALVQLVTVRNLPYNCNIWPELHALLMVANYTAEELINTSHGHVQKLCSNSYAIHKDILRKKLQSSPAKLHLSADVWSAPNYKAFLGTCVQFMQEGTKNPCQALLALPELPGIDGPGSHSGAEQWKLLQPVIEEYGISRQLGYITGDNHGSNDVLCRLLSHFLDGRGVAWNARHRRIRCHGHVVNLCVQAFLFMVRKEAVLEACRQIEEMDQASFSIDMMQGWKKRKERGWSQLGPLGKLHNTAIHIRAKDYRYNLFRRRAGKVLGLDNDTRWNSWFLLLDAALDKEEHIKWYQDKYYDALVDDYLAPQDWQNLRETRNLLQPFRKTTLLTEGYRSTLDRTLFTMDVLHKHYQQAFNKYKMNQQLLGPVLTSWHVFDKYYQLSDESPAYSAALILHPSRGKAHIQKNWSKAWHKKIFTGVKKLWEDEYKHLPTVYTTPSIVPALELDEYDLLAQELNVIGTEPDVDEYETYTSQPPIPIDCPPLVWWLLDEQKERFPRLSKVAIDILSIPAMSADPERTFPGASTIEKGECLKSWIRSGITAGLQVDEVEQYEYMA